MKWGNWTFYVQLLPRIFSDFFYLNKICRKLHKEHSFWKEKRKSISLDGSTIELLLKFSNLWRYVFYELCILLMQVEGMLHPVTTKGEGGILRFNRGYATANVLRSKLCGKNKHQVSRAGRIFTTLLQFGDFFMFEYQFGCARCVHLSN